MNAQSNPHFSESFAAQLDDATAAFIEKIIGPAHVGTHRRAVAQTLRSEIATGVGMTAARLITDHLPILPIPTPMRADELAASGWALGHRGATVLNKALFKFGHGFDPAALRPHYFDGLSACDIQRSCPSWAPAVAAGLYATQWGEAPLVSASRSARYLMQLAGADVKEWHSGGGFLPLNPVDHGR